MGKHRFLLDSAPFCLRPKHAQIAGSLFVPRSLGGGPTGGASNATLISYPDLFLRT